MTAPKPNEVDDSLSDGDHIVYAPCQPIGCDNGYHLPGCVYIEVLIPRGPVKPPYGSPERAAWDAEHGSAS